MIIIIIIFFQGWPCIPTSATTATVLSPEAGLSQVIQVMMKKNSNFFALRAPGHFAKPPGPPPNYGPGPLNR